jgi:hypothetical protein
VVLVVRHGAAGRPERWSEVLGPKRQAFPEVRTSRRLSRPTVRGREGAVVASRARGLMEAPAHMSESAMTWRKRQETVALWRVGPAQPARRRLATRN